MSPFPNYLITDFNALVINALHENETLSKKALLARITKAFPSLSKNVINWRLHKLKANGSIQSPSYGTYSLKAKENYLPVLSSALKRLYNKIQKEYPEVQLCVWDSRWVNAFLPTPSANGYVVAEVKKEFTESVYNSLTDLSKKVFLDPDTDIYTRYISNIREAIIIKPLISESPTIEIEGVQIASLEKLLVDCLAENDLFQIKNSDLHVAFKTIEGKYNLSVGKMNRYSKRRSQYEQLSQLMLQTK